MNTHQVARGAFGVAGLLLAAEAAGRTGMVDTRIVPLASTVLTGAAQPAASAHIANLSVPSATCRGCVLLCAHIPRSPFLTGLSIEERGGGLFEVFEI